MFITESISNRKGLIKLFTGLCILSVILLWGHSFQSLQQTLPTSVDGEFSPVSTRTMQQQPNYQPVLCTSILDDLDENGLPRTFTDPNNGTIFSRHTVTNPAFQVSLHHHSIDPVRWVIMNSGNYYETALVDVFVEILNKSPQNARVIDVGGNIGFFSLSASQGHGVKVDAFEPNIVNIFRFCQSLKLNNWTSEFESKPSQRINKPEDNNNHHNNAANVNIHQYGVGKTEGTLHFGIPIKNPGAGGIMKNPRQNVGKKRVERINVLTLDAFAQDRGWFQSRPHIAILKVDVEGHEANVLLGARDFLKSRLARNIVFEITVKREKHRDSIQPVLTMLVEAGYKLVKIGDWRGPDQKSDWPDDANLPTNIVDACLKKKSRQMNLWWGL